MGDFERAEKEAKECMELHPNGETQAILDELAKEKATRFIDPEKLVQTDDIVFTCPEGTPYDFDPVVYKEKGVGGSESALVEMASLIHELTGRPVKVFTRRTNRPEGIFSGVEYLSTAKVNQFFSQFKPALHIAWRHNQKLTNAPTYLWCHDLFVPNIQNTSNYNKVLCLSEFHKNYLMSLAGVPEDKIMVTRNGVEIEKFVPRGTKDKVVGKVLYSSSPDRGLDRTLLVMDKVVQEVPEAKLHVFYGFDNMRKMGATAEADRLERMIKERPYVVMHGNLPKKELYEHMSDAQVWLYPTNFLETFCITALEMLAHGVYPVVRNYGALPNTLASAYNRGHAKIIDNFAETDEELDVFARETVNAIKENLCKQVTLDLSEHTWESVAKEWLNAWQSHLTYKSLATP
jgi:glycosyltransferase involved in cell wall biosynthesis